MNRFICIALTFALAGCTKQTPQNQQVAQQVVDWENVSDISSTELKLYFISRDSTKLVSEMRPIEYASQERLAELAVEELLKGPVDTYNMQNPFMTTFADAIELLSVEQSGNVVNVNFSQNFRTSLDEGMMLKARAAITNTLIRATGIEFVNVFVDEYALGYYGYPLGAMRVLEYDLDDYVTQVKQETNSYSLNNRKNITLYFPDVTGKFLMCETREVELSDINYTQAILDELIKKGPTDTEVLQKLFEGDAPNFDITEVPYVTALSSRITVNVSAKPKNEELVTASIVCSLQGFLTKDKVDSVAIIYNQPGALPGENMYMSKIDYSNLLGNVITLYFPLDDGQGVGMQKRVIAQQDALDPEAIIQELITGPTQSDASKIVPAFANTVDPTDLRDVKVSQDIAVVNLSKALLEKCADMEDNQKRLLIYSIVNSITQLDTIKQVQLTFEGEVLQQKFGKLDLYGPLLRNPGIIFES